MTDKCFVFLDCKEDCRNEFKCDIQITKCPEERVVVILDENTISNQDVVVMTQKLRSFTCGSANLSPQQTDDSSPERVLGK